jgi:hypothetical protein
MLLHAPDEVARLIVLVLQLIDALVLERQLAFEISDALFGDSSA